MTSHIHIPHSSVAISRIGFGCARLFGGSELRKSTQLIEAALNNGISHFDTAPLYGSEHILGEVLQGNDNITITTKVGISAAPDSFSFKQRVLGPLYRHTARPILGRLPALKSTLLAARARKTQKVESKPIVKRQLSRDEILRELETSLNRLRRTSIDLYLLHEPDQFEITDELLAIFESLLHAGVIGAFGLGYDRALTTPEHSFGSVLQSRYTAQTDNIEKSTPVRIFHGVLRYGRQEQQSFISNESAGERISRVLRTNPNSSVIFSASSAHQIENVFKHIAL